MKNLELLPLSEETKKRLNEFAIQYKRYGHIVVEIISFDENRLIVRVEQKDLVNGLQLTKSELEKRVRDMFSGEIPEEWSLTISAVDFDRKDIEHIDASWIKNRMQKLDLKAKHVCTHTGIDKSTFSSLLSDTKQLTKWHRIALYYFFKYYEVTNFNSVVKAVSNA